MVVANLRHTWNTPLSPRAAQGAQPHQQIPATRGTPRLAPRSAGRTTPSANPRVSAKAAEQLNNVRPAQGRR